MKVLSYVAMGGAIYMVLTGQVYFSLILILLSFQLGNESELSKIRGVVAHLYHDMEMMVNTMIGVPDEKPEEKADK